MKMFMFVVFVVTFCVPVDAGFRSRRQNQTVIQINQNRGFSQQQNRCNNGVLQSRGFHSQRNQDNIQIRIRGR